MTKMGNVMIPAGDPLLHFGRHATSEVQASDSGWREVVCFSPWA